MISLLLFVLLLPCGTNGPLSDDVVVVFFVDVTVWDQWATFGTQNDADSFVYLSTKLAARRGGRRADTHLGPTALP